MSTNESLSQSDEQAITIQPSAIAAYPGSADWIAANGSEPAQQNIGGAAVLHAIRRHLLLILLIGLPCAVATGVAIWWFMPVKYQAKAYLELAASNPFILGATTAEQSQHVFNEFEIFRENQAQFLKREDVLNAALRDPDLKKLSCIQDVDKSDSTGVGALQWLTEALHVEVPAKNGGVINVSATEPVDRDDPSMSPGKPAQVIVNAVVNAYMKIVVNGEKDIRLKRLDELGQAKIGKEKIVRDLRGQLMSLQKSEEVTDERSLASKLQLAVSMYIESQREFLRMKAEQRAAVGKLREAEKKLNEMENDQAGTEMIPEAEVVMLLNSNPLYQNLQVRLSMLQGISRWHNNAIAQGTKIPAGFNRTQAEFEGAQAQLEQLRDQTRKMVRDARLIALKQEKRHWEHEVNISAGQAAAIEKDAEKNKGIAEAAGRTTIAVQMMEADVAENDRLLRKIAEEQEQLNVELKSASRVTPHLAELPEHAARDFRKLFILFGVVLGMFIPTAGVVGWDLRTQRVNCTNDVSKRLRIPVIGAVPRIPATVMRRLGDSTRKSQTWKLRFTESVDGVAARLLRKCECDQTRVILITSAVSGEGKTTLATQLAMSLARAQRRTVLVDFDVRQPTLDGALGLPLGPGICEALRGEGDVMGMVQQTETENLSVVTAGSWNRQVLSTLSNGVVGTVLEQLRLNFDFVIIDSSPLLPIVDTRLVCQHVDAVLLAVLRDVSQGSKVMAAHEMLDAFGVRSVEAVVTGGEEHGGDKNLAYQAVMLNGQARPSGNGAETAKDVQSAEANRQ